MKDELCSPGAVIGSIVVACLLGGIALGIYNGWPVVRPVFKPGYSLGDVIAAVAALATCAAVIVALRVAGAETRRVNAEKLAVAQVQASRISVRLSMITADVHSLATRLALRTINDKDHDAQVLLQHAVRDLCEKKHYEPTDVALLALMSLPNNCAPRIARAYEIFHDLKSKLSAPDLARNYVVGRPLFREKCLADWTFLVTDMDLLLTAACAECVKATELSAPKPAITHVNEDSA